MASVVSLVSKDDIPEFLQTEDVRKSLFFCSKAQLVLLAEYFDIDVSSTSKKGEILLKVITAMQLSESTDEGEGEKGSDVRSLSERVELEKLKLEMYRLETEHERFRLLKEQENERLKLEKEKLEKEQERESERLRLERERESEQLKLEHEEREKIRVYELEKMRLEARSEAGSPNSSVERFNLSAAIKMVPTFSEKEVVEFFLSFEKLARRLDWPRDKWTTIAQCRFIGKAQKVYSALSDEFSVDYDRVKAAILKAYELVPEAYRQKFRELKKNFNQTFVEFARDKERAFEDWCRSKEVDDYDKLRMLILSEEFKNCIPREIKVHLEDIKVDDLHESARLADEYSIAHKFSYRSKFSGGKQGNSGKNVGKDKEGK